MRRIYFEPRKAVCGVTFGTPRKAAEKAFVESLGPVMKERVIDDEKEVTECTHCDGVKVYYCEGAFAYMRTTPDRNNVNIIVGTRNVTPITESTIMQGLGMRSNPDMSKGVRITPNGRKYNVDMFAESDLASSIFVDESQPVTERMEERTPKKPDWMYARSKQMSFNEASTSLTRFYNDIKSNPDDTEAPFTSTPAPEMVKHRYMSRVHQFADELRDDCCKHIILHVYCHMNPLDKDYVDANKPKLAGDVDNMLASKGMNGTAYLTSCSEKTKAPVMEFVNRAVGYIVQDYIERMTNEYNEADELGVQLPPPEDPPTTDDPVVKQQLGEIQNDDQFASALDQIRAQTRSQIVDNISKLIIDKKNEKDMSFTPDKDNTDAKAAAKKAMEDKSSNQQQQQQPQPVQQAPQAESALQVCMNFIAQQQLMEGVNPDRKLQDELLGMAIRECTLYEMDKVFKQVDRYDQKPFIESVEKGNGLVVNAVSITESFNQA